MRILPIELGGEIASNSAAVLTTGRERNPDYQDASLLPYCEDIAQGLEGYEYAVVGGLSIDAFNHENSVIDPSTCSITVSDDFDAGLLRKNGTVRDYDIFVLGDTKEGFKRRVLKLLHRKL